MPTILASEEDYDYKFHYIQIDHILTVSCYFVVWLYHIFTLFFIFPYSSNSQKMLVFLTFIVTDVVQM